LAAVGKDIEPFPTACGLFFLQRSDALFDGLHLLLQALQILLEPGDLFFLGPKAWSGTGVSTATGATPVTVMVALMYTLVMTFRSTAHISHLLSY
jgi:hypothetical protein